MRALGTDLISFVSPADEREFRVPLEQAATALGELAERRRCSLERLSDEVGWELNEFLHAPSQTAAKQPLVFLKDIAAPLGFDWRCLLPPDDVA